jgi:4-hydroxy-tetrahydrodipicolinate synthase
MPRRLLCFLPRMWGVAGGTAVVTDATMPETEMQSRSQRIRGVLAPVVTPFKPDLSPDTEQFIVQCKWLLAQNCGLAPFGTTSEANSMSAEERMTLLEALLVAGIDPSRMMPGTGCCSITETVQLTAHAVKHGCAGVLMLPPFYYKNVDEEGLYRYFSEVIHRVDDARLKIYFYHIPPVAMMGITPRLVERLLKAFPNAIAGMKDSSGDWNNTKTFLEAFSMYGFEVFVGSESFLLANMRNGGAGTISATANVNPAAIDALYQSAKSQPPKPKLQGNSKDQTSKMDAPSGEATPEPEAMQARLNLVRDVFAAKSWPSMVAVIKQAIAICRNDPGWTRVRPPLVELTTEQARTLTEQLAAIDFAMPAIG